jgi:hypothetical protein
MVDNNDLSLAGEQVMDGIARPLLEQILGAIVSQFNAYDCVTLAMASDYFQINDLTTLCTAIFKKHILRVEKAAQNEICIIDPLKQTVLDFMAEEFRNCSQTPGVCKTLSVTTFDGH